MVIKKYLCNAPRPESWDDHVEDVLKHLGSPATSKAGKAELLTQMIESVKAMAMAMAMAMTMTMTMIIRMILRKSKPKIRKPMKKALMICHP
jgi:hypothetical protein